MDGTITIPTELEVAERALVRHAESVAASLRRRWPNGRVEFWVGSKGRVNCFIDDGDILGKTKHFPCRNLAEATEEALAYIANLPDPNACDPWFDPAHPMNQVAA